MIFAYASKYRGRGVTRVWLYGVLMRYSSVPVRERFRVWSLWLFAGKLVRLFACALVRLFANALVR